MFSHIICSKILMIVVLTYSVSQGPNCQYYFLNSTHRQLNESYSFFLKDEDTTCNQMTNSIYHKCQATLGHWKTIKKAMLDIARAIHIFQFDTLVLDGGVSHKKPEDKEEIIFHVPREINLW